MTNLSSRGGGVRLSQNALSITFIAILAALAYLPFAGRLGFYQDDWHAVWGAATSGQWKVFDLYLTDRPLMGLNYTLSFFLLGLKPLGWHLYAFALRLGDGLVFFWLVRMLWPGQRLAGTVMATLMTVFPGFLLQPNPNMYHNHLAAMGLGLLSIALTVRCQSATRPAARVWMTVLSMLLAAGCYLILEYLVGLEGMRLALLWMLQRRGKEQPARQRLVKTAAAFLPNLAGLAGFLVWRVLFFKSARSVVDVGSLALKYRSDPAGMVLRLGVEALKDFFETVFGAWAVPLYNFASGSAASEFLTAAAVAAAALLCGWAYLQAVHRRVVPADEEETGGWEWEAMLAGAACVVMTLLPVVFSNRDVRFQDTFDRYTLQAAPGAAMLLAGGLSAALQTRWRFILVGGLLGAAILTHNLNAARFARFWEIQRQVWWQTAWRVPDLKDNTALLAVLPRGYRLAESYEVWGPANLIYRPDSPVIKISAEALNNETIFNVLHGYSYGRTFRRMETMVDLGNALVLSLPVEGACLHIQDGADPEISELEDPLVRLAAGRSRPELIETRSAPHTPPADIFGGEPAHGWCYYYQKASLAAQQGEWEETARLGDEAARLGFTPVDVSEWMPFYKAYARLRRYDEANALGAFLKASPNFINPYCDSRRQSSPQAAGGSEAFIVNNLCPDLAGTS